MRKKRTVGNVLTRGIFSSYRRKQNFGGAGAALCFSENIPQTKVINSHTIMINGIWDFFF